MTALAKEKPITRIAAYAYNIFIDACGPILSPSQIASKLLHLPARPEVSDAVPMYIRDHMVGDIYRLHIPTATGIVVAQTIDFMIRQGGA